ncbi:MAG: hypothetical protein KDA57_23445, partial [Planctomycetales bacterium]|nr:hypothetical protein [Planctomycetales bacterium]
CQYMHDPMSLLWLSWFCLLDDLLAFSQTICQDERENLGLRSLCSFGLRPKVERKRNCVGSTWCRYNVQDGVGFAIEIAMRYRDI